jgi:hypothetical protein
VAFYRMAVHIDGRLLGYTDRLEEKLKVGDTVTADLAVNSSGGGQPYMHGTPGRLVARAVFKGKSIAALCYLNRAFNWLPDSGSAFRMRIRIQEGLKELK